MGQAIITEGASEGLERCRLFLQTKAPEAVRHAIERQFLPLCYLNMLL
jgi:hypothetical protein